MSLLMVATIVFPVSRILNTCKYLNDKLSVLKSRDITLPTKIHIVKAMVFPVATHSCEELDHKEGRMPKN